MDVGLVESHTTNLSVTIHCEPSGEGPYVACILIGRERSSV